MEYTVERRFNNHYEINKDQDAVILFHGFTLYLTNGTSTFMEDFECHYRKYVLPSNVDVMILFFSLKRK